MLGMGNGKGGILAKFGIFMALFGVFAGSLFATDATSQATVTNAAPTVGAVTTTDSGSGVDLSAGSTKIGCNATITDTNGYNDVTTVNATLWANTTTMGAANDNNDHYTNSSCTLSGGSGTTVVANCNFTVQYYANNTLWNCNITAVDNSSETGAQNATLTINQLIGLSIGSATLNFGAALAQNSGHGTSNQTQTITNTGNDQLDIVVNGTALSHATLVANIPVANVEYDITDNSMGAETALSATATALTSFNLAERTNDGAASTKDSWWDLHVPAGSAQWVPAGTYSGTITVTAQAG